VPSPPFNPNTVPFQLPVVAISTAPGRPSDSSQHVIVESAVVDGIAGFAHHVAARRFTLPSRADTICQGGTFISDGLEIKCTPVERSPSTSTSLDDFAPSPLTSACTSLGPPFSPPAGSLHPSPPTHSAVL